MVDGERDIDHGADLDRADAVRDLNVFCQMRMKTHDPHARRDFERLVPRHEEALECYSMSGEWACLIRVVVWDVKDYEQFLTYETVANSSSYFA